MTIAKVMLGALGVYAALVVGGIAVLFLMEARDQ